LARLDDRDRPPGFDKCLRARNITCRDPARRRVKFGIASDVTDLDGAGTPQFGIAANVAGLDGATLGGDGRVTFDISGGHRTAACAQRDVSINVTDVDVPTTGVEVEVDIFRSGDFQNTGAAARVFGLILRAILPNLRTVGLNIDDGITAICVHL